MSFRLFGVNIEIQPTFWLMAGLLVWWSIPNPRENWPFMVVFALVILVSILVHEFGHAVAIMRHRIEPEITLHGMGGHTSWRALLPLRRLDMVVISAAGPFAGFILAAILYGALHLAPTQISHLPRIAQYAIRAGVDVNFYWGMFNLIPVLPFDGGHIVEQALGPKRARISAAISLVVGGGAAIYFGMQGQYWATYLVGMGAIRALQSLQDSAPIAAARGTERRWSSPAKEPIPAELAALLQSARAALADDDYNRALAIAHRVLEGDGGEVRVPPAAAREAHEIIAWTHLLEGRTDAANEALARAKKLGDVDAALNGSILFARRDLAAARKVLEEARSRGDDRKEVVGPLIQILIEQGEVARAAAVALDIVDGLSTEDARKMAEIAVDHRVYSWAARLFAALFDRERDADDAYSAARALALDGNQERALEWLRKAVEAGFTDRARAWSDAALEALRRTSGLESVLPRP